MPERDESPMNNLKVNAANLNSQ